MIIKATGCIIIDGPYKVINAMSHLEEGRTYIKIYYIVALEKIQS